MDAPAGRTLAHHERSRRARRPGCAAAALAVVLVLFAAVPACAGRGPIHATRLTSADGLSQNTVSAIVQDREGYVWLATGDGLNRYDGYEIAVFRHEAGNPASLAENYLRSLAEDADGFLWVGTAGTGLDRFDPRTGRAAHFRHVPGDPHSLPGDKDVAALAFDRSGILWVGTGNGLARLAPGSGRFEPVALGDRAPGVLAIHHGASGRVYVGTSGHGVYVGAAEDRRLERLPLDGIAGEGFDLAVGAIHEDAGGTLWLATEGTGLLRVRLSGARGEAYAYRRAPSSPVDFPDDEVTSILPGDGGRLWLGTWNAGLVDFDPATGRSTVHGHSLADPRSLSSDTVISLTRDAGGMIWAGTYARGANRFPTDVPFEHYRSDPLHRPTLPDNTVWAFAPVRNDGVRNDGVRNDGAGSDGVWTATAHGLGLFGLAERRFIDFAKPSGEDAPLLDKDMRALAAVGDGLWIGTWGHGLLHWDRSAGTLSRFRAAPDDPASLSNDRVRLILPSRDGRLWIGTQAGLNRLDPATGRFERFLHVDGDPASLPHNRIRALHEDRAGTLWVGTSGGLSRLGADGRFTTWNMGTTAPGVMNDDDVRDIQEEPDGTLWLATGNGLTRVDPVAGPLRTAGERHGFRNTTLYGILADDAGQLWISTNFGLSRFDPAAWTARTFTADDGLQDNEFNFGAHLRLGDGAMLFGGINGFNLFRPEEVAGPLPAGAAPILAVQRLSVMSSDGSETEPPADGTPVRLSHRDAGLSVRFAALYYDAPAATRYASRLEGLDPAWSPLRSGAREVRYSELPAGRYVFRAKAVSARGVPAANEIAIPIIVAPAPWRTGWAYAAYAAAALAAAAGFHVARVRLVAHDAARLKREVMRQTRELAEKAGEIAAKNRELSDLLAFRSTLYRTLSHELRTPLTVVLSALQDMAANRTGTASSGAVMACLSSARRLSRLVDQLLVLARTDRLPAPRADAEVADLADVAARLVPAFEVLAGARGIAFSAAVAGDCPVCVPAEAIEVIAQNLLSNAVKYTPAGGHVTLSVGRAGGMGVLAVNDTGIGIPAEHRETIFREFFRIPQADVAREAGVGLGLALVRGLVDRYGGQVQLHSEPGQGAHFTVSFPLAGADAAASGHSEDPEDLPAAAGPGPAAIPTGRSSLVIIEDDPELVRWLPHLFEPEFACRVETNVDDGLDAVRELMPDAVLCDVMLRPESDDRSGLELAAAIRADPLVGHIPIVLLTALGDGDSRVEGLRRGVDDYITKPFDNEELRLRVRNLVANRRRLRGHVRQRLTDPAVTAGVDEADLPLFPAASLDASSRRFLSELERHVMIGIDDDDAALPKIAAKFDIGERQLQRRLKDICDLSFSEFRTAVRMREARRLLATDRSVTDIAHHLGYSSSAYFSKIFRKSNGMSPGAWRRQHAGEAASE